MNNSQLNYISSRLNLVLSNVKQTIQLFDECGTVPFIARYRKEQTGNLDEVQIIAIKELAQKLSDADKRRETIIKAIEEQGKMTPELLKSLEKAIFLQELEDIYLPYKQKRKTKGSIAIENGLEPLAKIIFSQKENNIETLAKKFINEKVKTVADAIQGASDIMAEWINENIEARNAIRLVFEKSAILYAKVKKNKEKEGEKYQMYFDFEEPLKKIPSHRLLAIRRGEEEGFLVANITPDQDKAIAALDRIFLKGLAEPKSYVEDAISDSYKRLIKPSIETEFANFSKEKADNEAIVIFSQNLKQLLLASPLGQKNVLAIDPGYRSGCKIVILDAQGNLLNNTVIYPFDKPADSQKKIQDWIAQYHIECIAIGNGTAGRETEDFIKQINCLPAGCVYLISEQGASIYSASDIAREEFPDKDITVRGAISIGRRLMDPLAELVKIDPKSIGVGQYQHDVDQKSLKKTLDTVVESCVNAVGVNLNTASKHLLSYVAGLGPVLAGNIVKYRQENGNFKTRNQIKKVPRLGEKAFEQAAGFLRITQASNPLDSSGVHPERYELVDKIAKDLNCKTSELINNTDLIKKINLHQYISQSVGLLTLKDIIKELEKPALDPRPPLVNFEFDSTIKKPEDLREGMILDGLVTNITAFGCFVDIGVKQDGLVHLSQLSNQYITDPNQVVKLQQQVKVKVLEVDLDRKRISLSMKL